MATADAFETFYRVHYERVLKYVARRLADSEAAEEVCAECFVTAWKKFDPEAPFTTAWLYQTARNHIGNAYQSRQKEQQLLALLRTQATTEVTNSDIGIVGETMAELSENDREALRLTYWEQLSAVEVGIVLGCSEKAAWKRISRARESMRKAMNSHIEQHGGVR